MNAIVGRTAEGKVRPIKVTDDGELVVGEIVLNAEQITLDNLVEEGTSLVD